MLPLHIPLIPSFVQMSVMQCKKLRYFAASHEHDQPTEVVEQAAAADAAAIEDETSADAAQAADAAQQVAAHMDQ
jgi:hypothetical protein